MFPCFSFVLFYSLLSRGGGQFHFLGHFYIFFVSFLICVLLGHFSVLSFSPFFPFFLFQPPSKRYKISYTVPACESSDSFDLLSVKQHSISWVRHDGKSLKPGLQSPQPYNSHLASDWVDSVSRGDVLADVTMLAFPDPASFLAGQLHHHLQPQSPLLHPGMFWIGWRIRCKCSSISGTLKATSRANILTRPPHPSGSFTITSLVHFLPSSLLTRFCNASLLVPFRFGARWARLILLTSLRYAPHG